MLVHGDRRWPLDQRPISIGRLTECDVVLQGDKVSRRHAYVLATPEGPLLVDGSRHGTLVNGETMHAPWVLAEGDVLKVGPWSLQVMQSDLPALDRRISKASRLSRGGKFKDWLIRYGPSEVVGTLAAVGAAGAVGRATGSVIAAAYAGTIAETTVFYGIMALRETIHEAHHAGAEGKPFGKKDVLLVLRNLMLEFGVAEALDALLLRPFCMGVGIRLVGGNLGALVGKLVADLGFYGPVLTIYEWRLARNRTDEKAQRSRRTTAGAKRIAD
jgi:hypothetical protein